MALPLLLQSDAEISAVAQKMMTDAASTGVDFRDILKLLDAGLALWMAGEVERDTLESWAGFKRRVHETLDGLTQLAQPNTPAVAFTSAGFIATALGMIQGKTPSEIRAQILKVPNASITTLEREPSTRRWHVLNAPVDGFLPESIRTQI
jgi:broad specificity phosphatase PhoE